MTSPEGTIETPLEKLNSFVEKAIPEALDLHKRFDLEVWKRPSFHNHYHVAADIKASDLLINFALQNPSNDPLDIVGSLDKWNQIYPQVRISREELPKLIELAFAYHDLGFVCKADNSGFEDRYESKNHEAKSAQLLRKLILDSNLDRDQKRRYAILLTYLIEKTAVTDQGLTEPFSAFMQIVDQVGNFFLNKNKNINALLVEGDFDPKQESPELVAAAVVINHNWVPTRFKDLVDSYTGISGQTDVRNWQVIRKLLDVWGGCPFPDFIEPGSVESQALVQNLYEISAK